MPRRTGDPAAAQWCASHQGTVVDRYPASNASSDAPVAMGPTVRFCEFTGGEGAEPPDSRISVRLTTLASDQPSMAATAYLTKPEMAESGGSANPASVYCADLGGVEMGGQLAPDGGWVNGSGRDRRGPDVRLPRSLDHRLLGLGVPHHGHDPRGRSGGALPLEAGELRLSVCS